MSVTRSNVETKNEYEDEGPTVLQTNFPLSRIALAVYNESAYRQLLIGTSNNSTTAVWQDELLVVPGKERIRRKYLFGIRTRSGAHGEPAKVTYEAVGQNE